jgi:peptidoglycan/xylan/chitin deacetylase (PgdA/CDA1 family)
MIMRAQRRARRWVRATALLLIGGLAVGLIKITTAECFVLIGDVACRAHTTEKLVALTFDDGPSAEGVAAVLPVLARYRAKATFFLVGEQVRRPLVRRIVEAGHEIGNHSFNHRRMIFRNAGFYDEQIRRTDQVLVAAGAPRPTLFRPPFGQKLIGLPLALKRNDKRMIMWSSIDPTDRDPRIFADKILGEIRPGSIVLIHPMALGSVTERAALPLILDGLTRRGFRSVTVSELLASEPK